MGVACLPHFVGIIDSYPVWDYTRAAHCPALKSYNPILKEEGVGTTQSHLQGRH